MELLRNKSRLTKMQILLNIVIESPPDQRSISSALEITPQAVSEYLRKMEQNELVDLSQKGPRATVKGVEMLQRSLLRLKEFVDSSISSLSIIRSTDAIAFCDIKKGSKVGLFMHDGLLHACDPEGRGSTGISDHDAGEGEMVSISSLSGVLDMDTPLILTMNIKPARQGGGKNVLDPGSFNGLIDGYGNGTRPRTVVLDIEAAALLKRSGIRYNIEMPGPETIVNHIERGIPLLLIGTPYSLSSMMKGITMNIQNIEVIGIDMEEMKQHTAQ